jgi:hypothetical protein
MSIKAEASQSRTFCVLAFWCAQEVATVSCGSHPAALSLIADRHDQWAGASAAGLT